MNKQVGIIYMKLKILVVLFLLISVLFAGCIGDEEPTSEEVEIPTEIETPEEVETPIEIETPEEVETSEEVEVPEEVEISEKSEPKTYLIRLEKYLMRPSEVEIKTGDIVVWRNSQEPRRIFTLVSEEELFENKNLEYGKPFTHVFNETGIYNFSIIGQPKMTLNVSVIEA